MDRRSFLLKSGSTLAAVSTPTLNALSAAAVVNTVIPADDISGLTTQHWTTIAAVQNHLFPSDPEAPGAVEINALSYLHSYLSNPETDPVDAEFILTGVIELDKLSQQKTAKIFIDLANTEREQLLREYEQSQLGRRWLINILNYLFEALLTDPVYGGNPEGIGWKWLEHRAGEPRPPANKRYFLL